MRAVECKKIKKSKSDKVFLGIIFFFAVVLSTLLVVPLGWTIMASLKDVYGYIRSPLALPNKLFFQNYADAFKNLNVEVYSKGQQATVKYSFFNMFGFSFIIATVHSFMSVFACSLTAYAVAKYKFPGRNFLYSVAIVVMIVPIVGALPSQLTMYKKLGIYDNLIPFLLVGHTGLGFNFLLLCGAFGKLPAEYKEAAFIDGAGHYSIMFRIYYPMLFPLLAALFMLDFVGVWNNYMINVLWLPSYPNLAYGAYTFSWKSVSLGYSVPQVLAGYVILAVPTVLLWSLTQRFTTKHMVVGGLKG